VAVPFLAMNWLAGVDEAGLGPILGPLVVAGVAMSGPEGADPWQLLRKHVSRKRFEKRKVRVADSKKVHAGERGLRHLEATALVFWTVWHGELPPTLHDWLAALGADLVALARCPWYERLDLRLPLAADAGEVELLAALVERATRQQGIELRDIAVRPVDVEEWNALIADTDNKGRAHFHAYAEVLGRLLGRLPGSGHLVADRCGGRMHYRHDLARLRPGAHVEVVQEEPACSVYRLHEGAGTITVTFAERGEDRAFPTALASCFAKYLRELMVHVLNGWFAARVPGLQPTAGYFTDGHRFLGDLESHLQRLRVPRERLVRVR
jgi:ribonuclease HII